MGTTRTAITTDSGVELCFCLLIEGYDAILCSRENTDDAIVTAYAATELATVVPGLHVPERMAQRMELFSGKLDIPSARFVVSPDLADTFGIAVHRTAASTGTECYLNADLDSDDKTITVDDTTGFAGSGTIHIGTEYITYSGTSGTTFTGCQRGKFAPFKAYDEVEQRFARRHIISTIQGVKKRPLVTDYPRTWAGRMVRCMAHRVRTVAGVVTVDAFAEAETVFCGLLESVGDSEAGNTVLDCVHVNKLVSDSIILSDQWSATVRPGLYLSAGDGTDASTGVVFYCVEQPIDGGSDGHSNLTVVSGAPADHTEITEGWYEYDQILEALSIWLQGEYNASVFTMRQGFTRYNGSSGWVTRWFAGGYTAGSAEAYRYTFSGCLRILQVLGYTADDDNAVRFSTTNATTPVGQVDSPNSPLRTIAFQSVGESDDEDPNTLPYTRLEVNNPTGSWVTVGSNDLPDQFRFSTGDWGFLQVGDVFISGKYDSGNNRFTDLRIPDEAMSSFLGIGNKAKSKEDLKFYGTTTVDDNADVTVRQVVVLQNEMAVLLMKMFASTGTENYNNNTTYDVLDAQLGLGIPYEMLGGVGSTESLLYALFSLQGTTESGDITVILDKPTKFGELLKPELMLRGATLVTDGSLYKIATPVTPGSTPEHTLNVSNKAADASTSDPNRTRSTRTSRLIRDKITIEYNRSLDDKYRSNKSVVNLATVTDHGGYAKPITIKARNTIGGEKAQGAAVESQISELASFALGMFGNEITEVERSISRKYFHMLPGDTVSLTDDSVRNPLTGVRGVTGYPAFVEEIAVDWFSGIGQVKLILLGLDDSARYGVYSPSARLSAYNTGTGVATLLENEFTLPGDTDVTHFSVGDKVRFIEISPSDPASPSTWVDEIDSISSNDVTTVDNNGSGTYSSVLTYVMVSDDRSTAAATQQTDAYIADDADGQVQDETRSYLWARESLTSILNYATNTGSVYLDKDSTQYLELADGSQTGFDDTTAMTWAFDIRIDELSQYTVSSLGGKWDSTSGTWAWKIEHFHSPTSTLKFTVYGTGGDDNLSIAWAPELCRWYHLAGTFDGSDLHLYIDGETTATAGTTTTDINNASSHVRIGPTSNSVQYWSGNIDNYQFWSRALTQSEIIDFRRRELYGNEDGLICYLPFSSNFTDRTDNGHDFTGNGGPTVVSTVPWVLGSDPHRYPANLADNEGEPVSPHLHTNAAVTLNNLVSYKTAPQTPWIVGDTESSAWEYRYTSSDSAVWRLLTMFPMHLGAGRQSAGDRFGRQLYVSPMFYRVSGSAAVSCRITLTQVPPRGSDWDDVLYREPYTQLEFSTSSTTPLSPCPQAAKPPEWQGVTMVCIEVQADNTESVAFCGLPVCYYGPLQPL